MRHGGSPARKLRLTRLCGRAAAVVALGAALAACSSTLSRIPAELGGLPADTPARLEGERPAYPAVHDMPPPRQTTTMTPQELKQAETEMLHARDRQAKQPGAAKTEAKATNAKTDPKTTAKTTAKADAKADAETR